MFLDKLRNVLVSKNIGASSHCDRDLNCADSVHLDDKLLSISLVTESRATIERSILLFHFLRLLCLLDLQGNVRGYSSRIGLLVLLRLDVFSLGVWLPLRLLTGNVLWLINHVSVHGLWLSWLAWLGIVGLRGIILVLI